MPGVADPCGTVYRVVEDPAYVRRVQEASGQGLGPHTASIVFPPRRTIVLSLPPREEYGGWLCVVYWDRQGQELVHGFVNPCTLQKARWSKQGQAPRIRLAPYLVNQRCESNPVRMPRHEWTRGDGLRVYRIFSEKRTGVLRDVRRACDCRCWVRDGHTSHCGACPSLLAVYLRQAEFLDLLWQVLEEEEDLLLCDDHCAHRALAVAVFLKQETYAQVSLEGVGFHRCFEEVYSWTGPRQHVLRCRDPDPPYGPRDVFDFLAFFELAQYSASHLPERLVFARPAADRDRVWAVEPSLAGTAEERQHGFAPSRGRDAAPRGM